MAGIPINRDIINSRVGFLAKTLRDTLDEIGRIKGFLDDNDDAALAGMSFPADDLTLIRAAYTDLDKLRQIAHAQATQPEASDFFWNAKRLTGIE